MKNKIEELTIIVSEVNHSLSLKEKNLIATSTSQKTITNVKKKIKAPELDVKEIEEHYANKP